MLLSVTICSHGRLHGRAAISAGARLHARVCVDVGCRPLARQGLWAAGSAAPHRGNLPPLRPQWHAHHLCSPRAASLAAWRPCCVVQGGTPGDCSRAAASAASAGRPCHVPRCAFYQSSGPSVRVACSKVRFLSVLRSLCAHGMQHAAQLLLGRLARAVKMRMIHTEAVTCIPDSTRFLAAIKLQKRLSGGGANTDFFWDV